MFLSYSVFVQFTDEGGRMVTETFDVLSKLASVTQQWLFYKMSTPPSHTGLFATTIIIENNNQIVSCCIYYTCKCGIQFACSFFLLKCMTTWYYITNPRRLGLPSVSVCVCICVCVCVCLWLLCSAHKAVCNVDCFPYTWVSWNILDKCISERFRQVCLYLREKPWHLRHSFLNIPAEQARPLFEVIN